MNKTTRPKASSAGLILSDWITLGAIFAVILVVSLPRLRALALHQNELDAIQATKLLGKSVFAMETEPTLGGVLQIDSSLEHRLEDVEVLEQGSLLRRHGYLFDLTRTQTGEPAIRAWPWDCGETGYGAYVITKDAGLRGHPNAESLWSGPGNAPVLQDEDPAWRAVER